MKVEEEWDKKGGVSMRKATSKLSVTTLKGEKRVVFAKRLKLFVDSEVDDGDDDETVSS